MNLVRTTVRGRAHHTDHPLISQPTAVGGFTRRL